MRTYYIELQNASGIPMARYDQFFTLVYGRTVNMISWLTLELPPDVDASLFMVDGRLLVYRNGLFEMETIWLIRRFGITLSDQGEQVYKVQAVSCNERLVRRIVAYDTASAEADKTGEADDMMKDIVYENLGAGAVAKRQCPFLTIQANLTLAPSISKSFARMNVLTVLQEIADLSATLGTPLYFDIVPTISPLWEFRTYIGQRGVNRSSGSIIPLLLAPQMGTLINGQVTDDYADEVNDVYSAGDGTEATRVVEEVDDPARVALSPINRREGLRDCRNSVSVADLQDEARAGLYEGRARRIFTGEISQSQAVRYGIDWFWGDMAAAQFMGMTFDCLISTVQVDVGKGGEKISARLTSEQVI